MRFEEFLTMSFKGSDLDYAVSAVLYIAVISIVAFIVCELIFNSVCWLFDLIKEKLTAKRLGIRREDDQSYMGSIPLRDCPCCGTPPRAVLLNSRTKVGYIVCPGCDIKTERDRMPCAAIVWNRRPGLIDPLRPSDYKQMFEIDQKCSKY